MKKLLVLLSLASMASVVFGVGVIGLTPDVPTVAPATVFIDGSGFATAQSQTLFAVFTGAVDTETALFTGDDPSAGLTDVSGFASTMEGLLGLAPGTVTEVWQFVFQDTAPFDDIPNGNLASFNVGGPQTVYLQDGTGATTLDTATITPEPITVALLGLGGLFLRRRK